MNVMILRKETQLAVTIGKTKSIYVRLLRVFMVRLELVRFVTATVGCSYELLQAGLELATREST
jgi:hypothetical protein